MNPSPCKTLIVGFFVVCVCSFSMWVGSDAALAQDDSVLQEDGQSWLDALRTQPTLITRPWLSEYGIALSGEVTQFAFGVAGGIDNKAVPDPFGQGDTFKYTGHGEYDVKFDLDKLVGLPHGRLLVRAEHWWGTYGNVGLRSGTFSPPVFPAALPPVAESEGQLFLTNFSYTQPLHENFVMFVGKRDVLGDLDQDKFAGGDGTDQFMNQSFVANPAFLLGMPYSGFAGGFVIPGKDGHLLGWVRDPEDRTERILPNNLFSEGVIAGGELQIRIDPWNLPGHQTVGGVWKGFDQPDLDGFIEPPGQFSDEEPARSRTKSNAWTIYYSFDQHLQVYSEEIYGEERGWGLFGRASLSDGNPTPVKWFVSLGVGGDSPFRGKERDTFGLGWFYTGASNEFGPFAKAALGPRDGYGWELFYNVGVFPWLHVTPDVQLVRPGLGNLASDWAFVGGLRVKVFL